MANSDEKISKFVQAITAYAEEQSRKIHQEVEDFKAERLKEAEHKVMADVYELIHREQAELHNEMSREMSAVLGIYFPVAIDQKHRSNIGIHKITNDCNQIVIVLNGALKDSIPCFRALISYTLYNTTYLDHLSLSCLYSKHDGILSL